MLLHKTENNTKKTNRIHVEKVMVKNVKMVKSKLLWDEIELFKKKVVFIKKSSTNQFF